MSDAPLVSVVMSVLNDEPHVAATLDSILSQEGMDLEFIVIDDGSTDRTGEILDAYAARDPRLRIVHQENTGLTCALIRGCKLARGKYIARQDGGGDVSLPGRLRTQAAFLESHPDVVMTSCGTRFIGPEGEELYEIVQSGEALQIGLQNLNPAEQRGPSHHGTTMYRRSTYQSVEGYRPAFKVAQDQDLWLRMAESGLCVAIPKLLYIARYSCTSISATRRREQVLAKSILLASAARRRAGLDDLDLLERLTENFTRRPDQQTSVKSQIEADFYYFIGSLLKDAERERALIYFWKALKSRPYFPRAVIRYCYLRITSLTK